MKLLFMHNAVPEYRIPWFKRINERCDTHFVFTNEKIIKKQYHFDTDLSDIADLSYELAGSGIHAIKNIWKLIKKVKEFDLLFCFYAGEKISCAVRIFLGEMGGAKGKTEFKKNLN